MRTAVIAFGGNAFVPEGASGAYDEQASAIEEMAHVVTEVCNRGYRVVVTHGNGPQVGALAIQQEESVDMVPSQPLFALGAMSQGQLGHLLTVGIRNALADQVAVSALVTHVLVDAHDEAFSTPSKPIGPFFSQQEAQRLGAERGWTVRQSSADGYRRVVASPMPADVIEIDTLRTLVEAGVLVIAGGGGGVPLVRSADGRLRGVDAVIDKDRVARRMATALEAELLVLVTGVPGVALDFGTDSERLVDEMTVAEARDHLADGQFPPGSMGPKVESAVNFLADGGQRVVITSGHFVADALDDRHGTRIVPEGARRRQEATA